jgi:IclR family pca regulon transcriptional regulator
LETLAEHRLVVRDAQTRRYRLGLRTLDYANAVRDRLEVRHVALSHLVDLQHELDRQPDLVRCTMIALLDDIEVVLVDMIGAAVPRTDLTRRMRIPAHISATGRCLLAQLDRADLEVRLDRIYADGASTDPLHTRERLLQELNIIRERGYAISDREVGTNTRALAAPVLARTGAPLAAVGIVVNPASTSLEALVARYAARMVLIAERISQALRYRS